MSIRIVLSLVSVDDLSYTLDELMSTGSQIYFQFHLDAFTFVL